MDKLKKLYYDSKQGYISLTKLRKKLKENNIDIPYKDVKDFYQKQAINQIMKPVRKPKIFNSFIAKQAGDTFQMDIIVYDRFTYHNYKYMLVVIDIYSRFLQVRAMTNRRMETIINNFEDILKVIGTPNILQCDNEFNKNEFIKILEEYDIKTRFSDPHEINKNPIVERVNGTIAKQLQKIRISTNKYDWYNYLDDVVYNYNHTYHSTIKNTPIDVFTGKEINEQNYIKIDIKYNIGDKVRIMKTKKVFSKGDEITYSTDIYTVESINKNKIKLIDVSKLYKPYEIKKIDNIIETNDNDIINEPKTETATIKHDREMKQLDIKPENIIVEKRARTQTEKGKEYNKKK
jgi:hypothetical protein